MQAQVAEAAAIAAATSRDLSELAVLIPGRNSAGAENLRSDIQFKVSMRPTHGLSKNFCLLVLLDHSCHPPLFFRPHCRLMLIGTPRRFTCGVRLIS